jgi:hypothetical protein
LLNLTVSHQPVHLFDRMLGDQAARLRQRLADHRHRQRSARHHPQRGACQRIHPLGVQVMPIQIANKSANILELPKRPRLQTHRAAPTLHRPKQLHKAPESHL